MAPGRRRSSLTTASPAAQPGPNPVLGAHRRPPPQARCSRWRSNPTTLRRSHHERGVGAGSSIGGDAAARGLGHDEGGCAAGPAVAGPLSRSVVAPAPAALQSAPRPRVIIATIFGRSSTSNSLWDLITRAIIGPSTNSAARSRSTGGISSRSIARCTTSCRGRVRSASIEFLTAASSGSLAAALTTCSIRRRWAGSPATCTRWPSSSSRSVRSEPVLGVGTRSMEQSMQCTSRTLAEPQWRYRVVLATPDLLATASRVHASMPCSAMSA